MTDEDRQRQMDFIVEQQARFTVNMQKLEENMQKLEEADGRAAKRIDRLERVLKLVIRVGGRERKEAREKFGVMVNAQIRTDAALAKLAESQAHTDQRLDALINIVNEGRNGKPSVES